MRLPIPFLLYLVAIGLVGWVGLMVYEAIPEWDSEARKQATSEASKRAQTLILKGKGTGPINADWNYAANKPGSPATASATWWLQFKEINLIGKLPPPPEDPAAKDPDEPLPPPPVDMTPLEDLIELVAVVNNSSNDKLSVGTHVIVRYKPTANVQPPDWWLRENTPATPGAGGAGVRRDVVRTATDPRRLRGSTATSPMPSAMAGGSVDGVWQILWLEPEEGNERQSNRLWPEYDHIKMVEVAPDALSVFFVRELPPPQNGEPAPEPKKEELLQTSTEIPQEVLKALREIQPTARVTTPSGANRAVAANNGGWRNVEVTTRFGNEIHIGSEDRQRFEQDSNSFLQSLSVDPYVSRDSSRRGLNVRSVDPKVAAQYGINPGEVLLEINGSSVDSKASAVNKVEKDYKSGVRTFHTKWLSYGQIVDRVYQAPDK